jgi:hypothetical protein
VPIQKMTSIDFEMFYLMFRYDSGFQAYKFMDYWPVADFFATYGHLLTNLIIIIIANCYAINIYTFLNVCLICYMYMKATVKISGVAYNYFRQSGLQS